MNPERNRKLRLEFEALRNDLRIASSGRWVRGSHMRGYLRACADRCQVILDLLLDDAREGLGPDPDACVARETKRK